MGPDSKAPVVVCGLRMCLTESLCQNFLWIPRWLGGQWVLAQSYVLVKGMGLLFQSRGSLEDESAQGNRSGGFAFYCDDSACPLGTQ